jgi:hypothetical protein
MNKSAHLHSPAADLRRSTRSLVSASAWRLLLDLEELRTSGFPGVWQRNWAPFIDMSSAIPAKIRLRFAHQRDLAYPVSRFGMRCIRPRF